MAGNSSILDFDDLIGRTDVFDVVLDGFDKIEKRAIRISKVLGARIALTDPNDTKSLQLQAKEVAKLETSLLKLKVEKEKSIKQRKKLVDLTNEELIAVQKEKIAQRERIAIAKQTAIIQQVGAKSIAGLRAQLSLTTIEWKKLTVGEGVNGKEAKRLIKTKLELTQRLKALEEQTGDNRRSTRDFDSGLRKLTKTAARVFIGRTLVDGLKRISTFLGGVIDKNKETSETLGALDVNLKRASNSIQSAAASLLIKLAPAINFVINAFIGLIELFVDTDAEAKKFSATSDSLASSIDNLEKGFIKESASASQAFAALSDLKKPTKERKELVDQINKQYGKYLPNLLTEKSSLEEIAKAQDLVNEALNTTFLLRIQQETQTDVFINKTRQITETFNLLRDAAARSGGEISTSFVGAFGKLSESIASGNVTVGELKEEFNSFNFSDSVFSESIKDLGGDVEEFVVVLRDAFRGSDRDVISSIFKQLGKDTRGYNDAITGTQGAIQSLQGQLKNFTREVDGSGDAVKKATSDRLKAIEQLIRDVEALETNNIKGKQERLLALEDLRFKEQQRLTENRLKELQEASKANQEELEKIEQAGQELREQQLIEHETKKLEISNSFADKAAQQAEKTVKQAQQLIKKDQQEQENLIKESIASTQKAIQGAEQQAAKDRKEEIKNTKTQIKELFADLNQLSNQASQVIEKVFQDQVKSTTDAVETQLSAVATAEERARLGLTNNVKFEKEQLAKRKSEQLKAAQEQKRAADSLALVQLVIAAAQNGNPDAVAKGAIQFGILKGLEAAIQGSFYEGTIDTGAGGNLDSKGGMLAVVHPHERVIKRSLNEQLGGMSSEDLVLYSNVGRSIMEGEHKADSNHYERHAKAIDQPKREATLSSKEAIRELRELRRAVEAMPVVDTKIEQLYKDVIGFTKKTTVNHMTKVEKRRQHI